MTENKKERQCIVLSEDYSKGSNVYYYGGATYGSDFYKAVIYNENEIPEFIKNNSHEKIIFLDTKEGLELLVNETHKLQRYVDEEEGRIARAKEGLNRLYSLPLIQEYIKEHNKRYNNLLGLSPELKDRIIEELVKRKK